LALTSSEAQRQRVLIEEHLEAVLGSQVFSGSQRCQEFLRFVVAHYLESQGEPLKERMIGASILGREPGYDTGQDSIVRVKANDVRKRLAQYYGDEGMHSVLRIQLPAGSYQPLFVWGAEGAAESTRQRTSRRQWRWIALLAAPVAIWCVWLLWPRPSALDLFWRPVLDAPGRVLLCLPQPTIYTLEGPHSLNLADAFAPGRTAGERKAALEGVTDAVITPHSTWYVGTGAATTLARISALLAVHGKTTDVRTSEEATFSELRGSPVVLIGGSSNQWTRKLMIGGRFVLGQSGNSSSSHVEDLQTGMLFTRSDRANPVDYAIISRLIDSKTGQIVVTVAGLGPPGTGGAGEFVTDAKLIEQGFSRLPQGARHKNVQFVIQVDLGNQTPGPPKVVGAHSW
jgi:hypothetical protein